MNKVPLITEEIKGKKLSITFVSQICHVLSFRIRHATQLKKSMLIISIDIDVGSKRLGQINSGKNDRIVNKYLSEYTVGEIEETALPLFVNLFESMSFPATFAIRGQLVDCCEGSINCLIDSSIAHDIGSHGYSHRQFNTLSQGEADLEVRKTTEALRKTGITPKSFIFPRNKIFHLSLLESYGYRCFRKNGGIRHDSMRIEKIGNLYNICPTMSLDHNTDPTMLKRILNMAIEFKAPVHFWFHLWNFGTDRKSLLRNMNHILFPFLSYAQEKEGCGLLSFETMLSATEKITVFDY